MCVCVCVCLFPSCDLWMVYIPCLAFLLLGHVLRPSWDLEKKKLFVGTCSSSFLRLRGKLLVGTCSSSFLGLRKIFVGACSLSFSGLRNDLHPFMDDVRIFKTIYILLRNFILFFFLVEMYIHLRNLIVSFFLWTMYIILRNLIISFLCGWCTSI